MEIIIVLTLIALLLILFPFIGSVIAEGNENKQNRDMEKMIEEQNYLDAQNRYRLEIRDKVGIVLSDGREFNGEWVRAGLSAGASAIDFNKVGEILSRGNHSEIRFYSGERVSYMKSELAGTIELSVAGVSGTVAIQFNEIGSLWHGCVMPIGPF